MDRLSRRALLTVGVLLPFIAPGHSWEPSSTCSGQGTEEAVIHIASPENGIVVYYVSYLWCKENCQRINPQAPADFILILLGFALPAVIFSTAIPRRWRLDLPEQFFKAGRNRILTLSKLALSLPAICVVAALDMIGWITCIMTFAGPMVFGGIQEMLLDYWVVAFLSESLGVPARERLEVVITLLCGNLSRDPDDPTTRIHDSLIPFQFTQASLSSAKSRLIRIMNDQPNFGLTVGIPAVFFLGGFLYNAAQPTPAGAVSFGIYWMVLVLVAIISGTVLAGNSPNVVGILVGDDHISTPRTGLGLMDDIYDSQLRPVPLWDRGLSKYQWLKNTTLWQDQRCVQHDYFRKKIEIGRWNWAIITITTWLLVATPCLLSWSFDYLLPWPWLGCLSLLYAIYLTTQTWLIFVSLVLAYLNVPFHNVWGPSYLLLKGTPRSILLRFCLLIFTALSWVTTLAAALLTVIGSILQFSDRFETCFCSSPVSSWLEPAEQRLVILRYVYTDNGYRDFVHWRSEILYGGAAIFTCIICFFGWYYQRSLRSTLREVIEGIEQ